MTGETETNIEAELKAIANLTQEQCCELRRFAPAGHPYFVRDTPLAEAFEKRVEEVGGFTPAISKRLGWGER